MFATLLVISLNTRTQSKTEEEIKAEFDVWITSLNQEELQEFFMDKWSFDQLKTGQTHHEVFSIIGDQPDFWNFAYNRGVDLPDSSFEATYVFYAGPDSVYQTRWVFVELYFDQADTALTAGYYRGPVFDEEDESNKLVDP